MPDDFKQIINLAQDQLRQNLDDPVARARLVYELWWRWADFELYITSPVISATTPPKMIEPEQDEHVYRILDYGHKLTTSKTDMYSSGMSMCKLFYTIEKIICILDERLQAEGIDKETEVQVAIGGHKLAERKAFESIINLINRNVVVTNFDPEEWGEAYLQTVKRIAAQGYGYPPPAPRHRHGPPSPAGMSKDSKK